MTPKPATSAHRVRPFKTGQKRPPGPASKTGHRLAETPPMMSN